MKKLVLMAMVSGLTILAAGRGDCEEVPQKIDNAPPQIVAAPQMTSFARADAVKMAVRRNIDLRIEAHNASMAETDVARNYGIYDPFFFATGNGGEISTPGDPFFDSENALVVLGLTQNLSTGGNVSVTTQAGYTSFENDIPGTVSNDWQSSVGLTLTQPLLKNAGKKTTELNISLAANTLEESLERFRLVNSDTVLAVITAYNRLYTLRQITEYRVRALNAAQKLLEEITTRTKPTRLQVLEVGDTEYALAQRRKELVEAERNARDQEANLRYLIGMEEKIELDPIDPPSLEEPTETEEQAVKMALERRPELKALHIALRSSQLQEKVARHQTLPEFTIAGGGGLNGTADDFGRSVQEISDNPGTWWSAGAQFTAPLGNTTAENDYRRNKIQTEQVRTQIKAGEWRIRDEIEADMRALISARLQMQVAEKALPIAEQRQAEYLRLRGTEASTIQDLINADNDLYSARITKAEAEETFANAVAKLWRDIGVLLEHQGVHIDISKPGNLMGEAKY